MKLSNESPYLKEEYRLDLWRTREREREKEGSEELKEKKLHCKWFRRREREYLPLIPSHRLALKKCDALGNKNPLTRFPLLRLCVQCESYGVITISNWLENLLKSHNPRCCNNYSLNEYLLTTYILQLTNRWMLISQSNTNDKLQNLSVHA